MSSIMMETGSEGPEHDPYGYSEITVSRNNGDKVTLHSGLIVWVEVNGKRSDLCSAARPDIMNTPDEECVAIFERYAGVTPQVAERAYLRMQYVCKDCGVSDLESVSGYPGETFNVCRRCGNVVSSDFNLSAII